MNNLADRGYSFTLTQAKNPLRCSGPSKILVFILCGGISSDLATGGNTINTDRGDERSHTRHLAIKTRMEIVMGMFEKMVAGERSWICQGGW